MRRVVLALVPALLTAPFLIVPPGYGQESRRIERVEDKKAGQGPWASLEGIVAQAGYAVRISTNKAVYRVGDALQVTCEVPSEGYVNMFNVGEGEAEAVVLYPNKYHPDNHVTKAGRITIPGPGDPFTLPAETAQRTLIVVVHTKTRLNGYETGAGDGFLKMLSAPATRSFAVAAAESGRFGAGKAEVLIEE